jgi:maleylpyruvate isomerase
MSQPTPTLQALRASTADLVLGLAAEHWSEAEVAAPSLCDGWTRGHLLTHLARNADAIANTLAGALRGEIVERYPDGAAGRSAAIAAGADRTFTALVADVRDSAERLDRMFGAVSDADGWELPTDGEPAAGWIQRRWNEVEIHRIDLGADYTPDRWPPLFVSRLLPLVADSLNDRVETAVRVRVTADRSLVPDHVGAEWTAGSGDPVDVAGPDWAVLAWAIGRPAVAATALTATPPLQPWR